MNINEMVLTKEDELAMLEAWESDSPWYEILKEEIEEA